MTDPHHHPISHAEALSAQDVVYRQLSPSPLSHCPELSAALGAEIHVKHENRNPTGSFKIRGGINLMHHLARAGVGGVITFSTGNHGLSVAQSAAWQGIPATVVVPEHNNPVKNRRIRATGATLIEAGRNFEQASQAVAEISRRDSLYYAHPANEPHIINGVGTEFLEIIEALPALDAVILPVGAGSEVAAAITVLRAVKPAIEIYAVQAQASSAAWQSWRSGEILSADNRTFAGGFATGIAYELPFGIYRDALTDFVVLSEDEIYQGIALAAYYTHDMVEGAGGSTLMAAIRLREQLRGKRVVLQFSGGNASPEEIRKAYALDAFATGWEARD